MTNGEKFKQIFPNIQIDMGEIYIYVWIDHEPAHITKEWWNAEYKEPTTNNDVPDNNVGKIAPTTKNDLGADCISRAEAIDTIRQLYLDLATQKAVIDLLKILPSVTPQEPKTGHWISTETKGVRYAFWCRYKCSLCGGLSDRTNFCPNCGAKMESEDKE